MVPELEKPRVTEIHVRMDCNGCVQKIKKALHGINGIYDLQIDYPQQKLTVVGWVEPEKILKAIKRTKKIATICSYTDPSQPAEPAAEATDPPTESPPAEAPPPDETLKDPPPPESSTPEPPPPPPPPVATEPTENQTKAAEEIHLVHHHPQNHSFVHGYDNHWNDLPRPNGHGYWNNYSNGYAYPHEQPVYATHSYNTYKPSPYISEYQYAGLPSEHTYNSRMEQYNQDYHTNSNNGDASGSNRNNNIYSRMEQYSGDYHYSSNNGGASGSNRDNNITSMFSDENPNACRIV